MTAAALGAFGLVPSSVAPLAGGLESAVWRVEADGGTADLAAELLAGYVAAGSRALDASALPSLRFLAAVENLAVLSRYPAEAQAVLGELPWLLEQATAIAA